MDLTAPNLVISNTSPADNSKTATGLHNVSGTVDESSTVTVEVGNNLQSTAMSGTGFSAGITLAPGTNTVEITATDPAGKINTLKRSVVYNDQAPSLSISSPAQDITTSLANYLIRGTVSDPSTTVSVGISMDGQTYYSPAVVNGQFEQAVTFTTGKSYAIVVTATNEAGAKTTAQRNVIFTIQ